MTPTTGHGDAGLTRAGGHGVSVSHGLALVCYTDCMMTATGDRATDARMSRTVITVGHGVSMVDTAREVMLDSITTATGNRATDARMSRTVKINLHDTPVIDTARGIR